MTKKIKPIHPAPRTHLRNHIKNNYKNKRKKNLSFKDLLKYFIDKQ